jgi:hypothetical protein
VVRGCAVSIQGQPRGAATDAGADRHQLQAWVIRKVARSLGGATAPSSRCVTETGLADRRASAWQRGVTSFAWAFRAWPHESHPRRANLERRSRGLNYPRHRPLFRGHFAQCWNDFDGARWTRQRPNGIIAQVAIDRNRCMVCQRARPSQGKRRFRGFTARTPSGPLPPCWYSFPPLSLTAQASHWIGAFAS